MTLHMTSLFCFGHWKSYFSKINLPEAWLRSVNLSKTKQKRVQESSSNALKEVLAMICYSSLNVPKTCLLCPYYKRPSGMWEPMLPSLADWVHLFPTLHSVTSPLVIWNKSQVTSIYKVEINPGLFFSLRDRTVNISQHTADTFCLTSMSSFWLLITKN